MTHPHRPDAARRRLFAPTVIGLATCVLAASGLVGQSQTVTLASDRDNTAYEEGDLSNGIGTRMFSGSTFADVDRRAFVHFNVGRVVPAGSTIRSVDLLLEVVMVRTGAPATRVDVHRVTSDWGEGSSFASRGQGAGAPATPGDTTWTHAMFPGTRWNNLGGDFAAVSSASATVPGMGPVVIGSTNALVADVQAMLDVPAGNFGFALLGDESTLGAAVAWATREEPNPSAQPRLRITYDPPSAAATVFGSGCSAVSPFAIAPVGVPSLGNQSFGIQSSGTAGLLAPTASFALARRQSPLPLPGGGCPVWIDPSFIVAALAFPQPGGLLGLAIPNDANLIGARLYMQGIAASSSGDPVTANGIELAFGL